MVMLMEREGGKKQSFFFLTFFFFFFNCALKTTGALDVPLTDGKNYIL